MRDENDTPQMLITDLQVAKILNVSRATVWRHFKTGLLPRPVKVCGATRWRRDEVLQVIDNATATRDAAQ